jgi:hypothetical protein
MFTFAIQSVSGHISYFDSSRVVSFVEIKDEPDKVIVVMDNGTSEPVFVGIEASPAVFYRTLQMRSRFLNDVPILKEVTL